MLHFYTLKQLPNLFVQYAVDTLNTWMCSGSTREGCGSQGADGEGRYAGEE